MKFHIEIKCAGAALSDTLFFDAYGNPVGRAWTGEDKAADTRETACILAALRYWQWKRIRTDSSQRAADIRDIETNGGAIKPLSDDEIDDLCERINTGGVVPEAVAPQ